MLFVGGIGVFHLQEGGTGQLGTAAAVVIPSLVDSAVVEGTDLVGHHLHRPEGGALYVVATGAGGVEVFTFIAFETAGTFYHGVRIFMQVIYSIA